MVFEFEGLGLRFDVEILGLRFEVRGLSFGFEVLVFVVCSSRFDF